MDFKKRNDGSRPGRARNAERRGSGRDYKGRSKEEHSERGDEKPFRKRTFGNEGFKRNDSSERKNRFNKESGSDRPFRERRSFRRDDSSEGFERKPRVKTEDSNTERRPGRTFKRREDSNFGRRERSGGFQKRTSFGKDREDRSSGFSRDRGERPSRFRNDEENKRADRQDGYQKRSFSRERGGSFEEKRSFKRNFNENDEKPGRSFSGSKSFKKEEGSGYRSKNFKGSGFKSRGENRRARNQNVSVSPENADGLIRLNRFVAASGICSRREADDLIKAGLVTVNGKVISEMGVKVSPTDEVKYNGELIKSEKLVYILLNKPKDYVTTSSDPYAKQTVLDLLKGAGPERVFPVGRLDRNTTGVLLLTNDGDLTKKLTHPSFNKKKIYQVTLDKNLKPEHYGQIADGIELEDGFIKVDAINYIFPDDKKQIGVEIHSGKNHIVRRIFEHFEYRVSKLDRVYFAGLTKKNLKRGEWRYLTSQEIGMLKMGSYE